MPGSELESCKRTVWCSATNFQIMASILHGQPANCTPSRRSVAYCFAVPSAAASYRASGLVLWPFPDLSDLTDHVRYRRVDWTHFHKSADLERNPLTLNDRRN